LASFVALTESPDAAIIAKDAMTAKDLYHPFPVSVEVIIDKALIKSIGAQIRSLMSELRLLVTLSVSPCDVNIDDCFLYARLAAELLLPPFFTS
jgi:hypothetical protein